MKTANLLYSCCLTAILVPAAHAQIVLSFDVDERGAAPLTLAGFNSFVITSNTSATAVQSTPTVRTFGALTVTLAGLGSASYDDRIRTVPTNNLAAAPNFTQEQLLRDFVFQSSAVNGDGLSVTIDGLTAGQYYKATIWSYDNGSTGNRVSDWSANGFLAFAGYTFNGSVLPTNDLTYQLNFKIAASPSGQILIQGRRNGATSSAGGVFLNALQLEITTPDAPVITSQAVAQPTTPVFAGDIVRLSAGVSGTVPLSFQWRKNDVDIPGATNLNYNFAAPADGTGLYSLVVTNATGSITSSTAQVTVQPVANLETGRISYWPLDTVNGTLPDLTTPDVTASANHLYLTNLTASNLAQGIGGNAMSFNGTSTLVARLHTNSVNLPIYSFSSYSVALWVKGVFSNQLDRRVFSESSHTNNNPLLNIGTDSAGTNGAVDIFLRNDAGGTILNHRKSSLIAFDGNWHHIAWVDNNGFPTLYVDGVADTNDFSYVRTPLTPTITSLGAILRATPGNFYAGLIDDAVVYRRSLSAAEVLSIVQCSPSLTGTAPAITSSPQNRTNNAAATATFDVGPSGTERLLFQWYSGSNPIAGGTNSTLVLNNLSFAQSGSTYFATVSNCFGGAVTSATAVLTVNRLPTALNKGIATTQGRPATLPLDKLLAGTADADGDTVTVANVSVTSTNGGTVLLTSTNVIYTPVAGFSGIDRFNYTVGDGRGGFTTAAVEVFVAAGSLPAPNQVALTPTPQGYLVRFAGIPSLSYLLQRSPDLTNWTTLATIVAPLHGIIDYEDTNPPQPSAFYRTLAP